MSLRSIFGDVEFGFVANRLLLNVCSTGLLSAMCRRGMFRKIDVLHRVISPFDAMCLGSPSGPKLPLLATLTEPI